MHQKQMPRSLAHLTCYLHYLKQYNSLNSVLVRCVNLVNFYSFQITCHYTTHFCHTLAIGSRELTVSVITVAPRRRYTDAAPTPGVRSRKTKVFSAITFSYQFPIDYANYLSYKIDANLTDKQEVYIFKYIFIRKPHSLTKV